MVDERDAMGSHDEIGKRSGLKIRHPQGFPGSSPGASTFYALDLTPGRKQLFCRWLAVSAKVMKNPPSPEVIARIGERVSLNRLEEADLFTIRSFFSHMVPFYGREPSFIRVSA